MPMEFCCYDIKLTVLGVWAVLCLFFLNRLLTTFFLCSQFPFIHFLFALIYIPFHQFMFSHFLTFLILLPVLPFCSWALFFLLPPTFTISCLWIFCLFNLLPFFIWNFYLLKTPSLLPMMKIFILFYFSTFFPLSPSLSLSVPQWSFPVFLSVWPTPSWASLASMWSGGPRTRGW